MAVYLSVKDNSDKDGLYSFESSKYLKAVGDRIKNSKTYSETQKDVALKEMGLTDKDIKDGGILIKEFFKKDCYVGLKDTPFDGVYSFVSQNVAFGIIDDFKGHATLHNTKEDICKEFGISEGDIKDGGFLLSGVVKDYLKKLKKDQSKPQMSEKPKGEKSEKKAEKKEKNVTLFENMIKAIPEKYNVAEITMANGEVYRVTLKNIFYMANSEIFQNAAFINSENIPCIKAETINKLVEDGLIGICAKSTIEYKDGFCIIRNCDDPYSPNIESNEGIKIVHQIPCIVLNTNQVVSIVGKFGFDEITYEEITPKNFKLVYDYLDKTYKKG